MQTDGYYLGLEEGCVDPTSSRYSDQWCKQLRAAPVKAMEFGYHLEALG